MWCSSLPTPVRLDGVYYAVDPKLRGDRLIVRYDPFVGRSADPWSLRRGFV